VLPGEDENAAELIEGVFRRRGMTVLSRSRAAAVRRTGDGVEVELADGRVVEASHCLVAVGGVPATANLGLEEAGVELSESGPIKVDRVSRTRAFRIYAAGDCTGVLPLASVAAMQGRIAMWHALGDAVAPLDLSTVAANLFTAPEIATIGVTQKQIESGEVDGAITRLPVARNPRAKMLGIKEGFIKLFSERSSGVVIGGVIVAPRASELIYPITIAVAHRLTVDQLANVFTIYPSLTGSISEAARTLHLP
jgi:NAD(P)H dehydrogenase (quinone)